MLKNNKLSCPGVVLLSFFLLFMTGCESKPAAEKTPSPAIEQTDNDVSLDEEFDQTETASQFIKEQGYKIYMNSGAYMEIQLPENFSAKINDIEIGKLLEQRNELSQQNGLDFSDYLGKKVTLYTYGVENQQGESTDIDLLLDGNKVVGFWTDNNEKPDYNLIANTLQADD